MKQKEEVATADSPSTPLKFKDAAQIPKWNHLIKQTYRSRECTKTARAFVANLERCHALTMIPGYSFMSGEDWAECVAQAMNTVRTTNENHPEVQKCASKYINDRRGQRHRDLSIGKYRESTRNAEMLGYGSRTVREAFHSLMQTLVLQAWTAYEVMASDLWTRVTVKRPALDRRAQWTNDQRKKSNFTSRSGIANRFRWTFDVDNADILAVVDDPAVHALGIARNVLVHAGGRIDKRFQDDRRGFTIWGSPALIQIPMLKRIRGKNIGYPIPFSGDLVRSLIDPITPLGFKLVKSVDKWLNAHP